MLFYQTLVFITHRKTYKAYIITKNLKHQIQHGMINLNYQMGHILYQIFKIILSLFQKNNEKIDDPSIRLYVNKIENRITFKIKTGYYLELLTPETMKLLGSTESKITKDKIGENVPHFEIAEVVLVHCNIVNNDYQQDSRVLYTFVPNKPFGSLLEISPKNHIFLKTFNSEFQAVDVMFYRSKQSPIRNRR